MTVRAKFMCSYAGKEGSVAFRVVYSGSEENDKFFQATPIGEISMGILNEEALKMFEEGKEYYVDFIKAE